MTLMLQLVAVTPLQVLRVTWKPLVTAPKMMTHPVAPVGVAGVEAEGEGEDRVVGEELE